MKKLTITLLATVLVLWVISWPILRLFFEHTEVGTFGDSYGAINALFSGMAFVGVIITIYLQKLELGEQRKEIRASRIAHEDTVKSLNAQLELSIKSAKINIKGSLLETARKSLETTLETVTVKAMVNSRRLDTEIKIMENELIHLLKEKGGN